MGKRILVNADPAGVCKKCGLTEQPERKHVALSLDLNTKTGGGHFNAWASRRQLFLSSFTIV